MKTIDSQALDAARLIDRLERLARSGEPASGINAAQWEALRYFARANRFSRTPAALAAYLASTRGTISRTLAALESKGYLKRASSPRDGRSIDFRLTDKGLEALERDPLLQLAEDIELALGQEAARLRGDLALALRAAVARNHGRAFGVCGSCRYFLAQTQTGSAAPHRCTLLDEPLSEADSRQICVEQDPVAA
jgi:DNA-binding MarR family transcriptional regulator